jgi:hypothetical protein
MIAPGIVGEQRTTTVIVRHAWAALARSAESQSP